MTRFNRKRNRSTDSLFRVSRRESLFWFYLLLVFVGVSPFSGGVTNLEESTGAGNSIRQVLYVVLSGCILYYYSFRGRRAIWDDIPAGMLLVIGWIFLSTIWSASPDLTFRRAVLVALVTFSIFSAVNMLGIERSLATVRSLLALVMVVNLASIPIMPNATHPYGDGMAWAGMHGHKNVAGSVALIASLVFYHFWSRDRRFLDLSLLALSLVFLIGTRSKTSIALLGVLVLTMQAYNFCSLRKSRELAFRLIFCAIFAGLLLAALAYWDTLLNITADPDAFTGRGQLWAVVMSYVPNHFWLGSGFGAFWEGPSAPARSLIAANWMAGITHAHNSYLEIMASTGAVGLVLSLYAIFLMPIVWSLRFRTPDRVGGLALALVLFGLVGSITKSPLLNRDSPEWVAIVLAIAILAASTDGRDARNSIQQPRPQ